MSEKKNNLNVLTYGYFPVRSVCGFFSNIKQFFKNIKFAYQRITKGYCEWDTWELDNYYIEHLLATVSHLKETCHGYPGRKPWETEEKWKNYLNEIVEHLFNAAKGSDIELQRISDKYYEAYQNEPDYDLKMIKRETWYKAEDELWEFKTEERTKALKMIMKCWDSLWD